MPLTYTLTNQQSSILTPWVDILQLIPDHHITPSLPNSYHPDPYLLPLPLLQLVPQPSSHTRTIAPSHPRLRQYTGATATSPRALTSHANIPLQPVLSHVRFPLSHKPMFPQRLIIHIPNESIFPTPQTHEAKLSIHLPWANITKSIPYGLILPNLYPMSQYHPCLYLMSQHYQSISHEPIVPSPYQIEQYHPIHNP